MISIERARELLGDKSNKYSDREVEKIISEVRSLVEIIFEDWLDKKKKGKLPIVVNQKKS